MITANVVPTAKTPTQPAINNIATIAGSVFLRALEQTKGCPLWLTDAGGGLSMIR
jgi:hypothetical protein